MGHGSSASEGELTRSQMRAVGPSWGDCGGSLVRQRCVKVDSQLAQAWLRLMWLRLMWPRLMGWPAAHAVPEADARLSISWLF